MATKTFTVEESARFLSIPHITLTEWVREGLVPTHLPRGKKRGQLLDPVGLLISGVVRTMRNRGASKSIVDPVARFLSSLTPAALDQAIAEGRTILLAAGEDFPPMLIAPTGGWISAKRDIEMMLYCDIAACWNRIKEGLAKEKTASLLD